MLCTARRQAHDSRIALSHQSRHHAVPRARPHQQGRALRFQPDPSTPASSRKNGRYIMLFRNDYGCTREQFEKKAAILPAPTLASLSAMTASTGRWKASPCWNCAMKRSPRAYDPRITLHGWAVLRVLCRGHAPWRARRHLLHPRFPPFCAHQPQRARQPQYGALPGKDRRKIRAPGTPHAGVFHRRPFLRYLVVRFAGSRVLGQFPPGAQLPGCTLLQRQDRPWRAAAQDRRQAGW